VNAPPSGARPGLRDRRPAARTLADHALQAIREELLSGRWAAGSRIRLEETAEWLGMSLGPVREALRTLASEGLAVPLPQRGFRVPDISVADLEDTYRLRMMLDPLAVKLATPRLTPERLEAVAEAFADLCDAYRQEDWAVIDRAHRRFHFGINDAAGAPWLIRLCSMLWSNSQRYQHLSLPLRGSAEQRAEAHLGILEACRAGDAELAAERTREHLERTYLIVRRLLERQRASDGQTEQG
jgi:DNA-binding GntR family transcriptional regulator